MEDDPDVLRICDKAGNLPKKTMWVKGKWDVECKMKYVCMYSFDWFTVLLYVQIIIWAYISSLNNQVTNAQPQYM